MKCYMAYLFFFTTVCFSLFSLQYEVKFYGLKEIQTLKEIKNASNLVLFQKKPPRSINALRFRIDRDIPQMMKVLHAYGYFDAKIRSSLQEKNKKITVAITISSGQRYRLASFRIYLSPCEQKQLFSDFSLHQLQLEENDFFVAQKIINARLLLLSLFANRGYPLASIEDQKIVADAAQKTVDVSFCVHQGPMAQFGPTTMIGVTDIDSDFIKRKFAWKQGETYSAKKVEMTQKRLLDSDLFSSVMITHAGEIAENDLLPMKLHVTESKHRSLSLGVSYATIDGFGFNFSWAHRNLRHLGEQFFIKGEISQIGYVGSISYRKPDFIVLDQDFVTRFEATREDIFPYLAFTYSLTTRIDKRFSPTTEASWGLREEYDEITHSANDGRFILLSTPIFTKYSTAAPLLNPTKGLSLTYYAQPYFCPYDSVHFFFKQRLIYEGYLSMNKNESIILALRTELGSIVGPTAFTIPMTKLFLGGNDLTLRGYRYRSVSPRDERGKPIGGRGAIFISFEPRLRLTSTIGIVPFIDLGTVSIKEYPDPAKKWYKSAGIGLRYFTFFGPLRLDVGFPLNRRNIDYRYRIYISIGQTF